MKGSKILSCYFATVPTFFCVAMNDLTERKNSDDVGKENISEAIPLSE